MDENTKKRMVEKLEILVERVEFIKEHASERMLVDRIVRKALYKEFQEAVEAMSDVCAILRRALNSSAKDDYTNIDFLVEKGVLEHGLGRRLKEANGLKEQAHL